MLAVATIYSTHSLLTPHLCKHGYRPCLQQGHASSAAVNLTLVLLQGRMPVPLKDQQTQLLYWATSGNPRLAPNYSVMIQAAG